MNHEFPDVQAGFRKGRGTRDQIADIHWIIEKGREFQKNIYFCFIDCATLTVWITTNWKNLKEMGIPDHLTCLLRNPYAGQEATVRTGHGTTDWFKLGKGYVKAVYCHPAYLTYIQSTSCKMPANLENSAVATGLEKVNFHSNPKERPCKRMLKLPHNCTHLTCWESNAQNSSSQASTVHEP